MRNPAGLPVPSSENLIYLPDGKAMQLFRIPEKILPNGWSSVTQIILVKEEEGTTLDCVLRLTSEVTSLDIPFKLILLNS